jgi:hypothetical protein
LRGQIVANGRHISIGETKPAPQRVEHRASDTGVRATGTRTVIGTRLDLKRDLPAIWHHVNLTSAVRRDLRNRYDGWRRLRARRLNDCDHGGQRRECRDHGHRARNTN